jgi:hypothetical protein
MKFVKYAAAAVLLLGASAQLSAAPVTYTFDSISKIDINRPAPFLVGILQNTSTPTTVTISDDDSEHKSMKHCIPLFLTMIEKPGRYLLSVTIETSTPYFNLKGCALELKS